MNEITIKTILFIVLFLLLLKKLNLFFPEFFASLFVRFIVFILTFPKCFISAVCEKKTLYKFQILKCTFLMYIGAK